MYTIHIFLNTLLPLFLRIKYFGLFSNKHLTIFKLNVISHVLVDTEQQSSILFMNLISFNTM